MALIKFEHKFYVFSKQAVSPCETARFTTQKSLFRSTKQAL